jgi:hypothetical protein
MSLDPLSLAFCILGLLGGLVAFFAFISSRVTREELNSTISSAVQPVRDDIKYIRDRIDTAVKRTK